MSGIRGAVLAGLVLGLAGCAGQGEEPAAGAPAATPPARAPAPDPGLAQAFRGVLQAQVDEASGAGRSVLEGADGWLFFVPELRHLLRGRFWGEGAVADKEDADPLPAMLDLHAQLERAGIELLVVPVPAKAVVYPEAIAPGRKPVPRLDEGDRAFLGELQGHGVQVLDLLPELLAHRDDPEGPMYCRQDTHWSGRATVLAARAIATALAGRPWLAEVPERPLEAEERHVEIAGDLWRELPDPKPPRESLPLRFVGERVEGRLEPLKPWRASPVVLLGDSHNLVFHAGGVSHAVGAGLADQLAHELGFPVDVVAVQGSGATSARLNLLRRGDRLQGKRLVIWCFSVREFTEGQGWKKVPLIP